MASQNDKVKVVLVSSSTRRGIYLATDITYKNLLLKVGNKFNLVMDGGYSLYYKLSSNDDPMEITDDEEVSFFIEAARNENDKPLELLVHHPSISQQNFHQSSQYHQSSEYHRSSQYHQHYKNSNVSQTWEQYLNAPLFSSRGSYQNTLVSPLVNPTNLHNFFPNQYSDTKQYDTQHPQDNLDVQHQTRVPDTYDVGTSQKCSFDGGDDIDENVAYEEESEENEQYRSDGDEDKIKSKYIFPHEWQQNTFSYMPEPTQAPTYDMKQKTPISNNDTTCIWEGQWFLNKKDCQKNISLKSIKDGYEFKVRKSDKMRYDVICTNKGCQWKILTHRAHNGPGFYVTTLYDIHTCSKTQLKPKHRNATQDVLGDILMEQLKDPNRVYKPKDIVHDIGQNFHINISYHQAWRGKANALEKLRGSHEESFSKLPCYLHNLRLKNPGSVTDIKTDNYGRFEMCFVAIGVVIRSFLNHLRPVIIVDGAHLKGKYIGSNLLAVAMDGNNQIVPIAYGVTPGESGDAWGWFFSKLRECIGDIPNMVVISDRHASIALAVRTVFPYAFHVLCCRHLEMNLNLAKSDINWLYWKICKAHRVDEYDQYMNMLQGVRPKAYDALTKVRPERWSRAHCPVARYNYATSNSAESINALTVEARKMPITMLLEFFRGMLQRWYYERHLLAEQNQQQLTPWAQAKIQRRITKSNRCKVFGIDATRYQVHDQKKQFLVNLETNECTCLKWLHSGLPCNHAIKVFEVVHITDCAYQVKHWFTIPTYKATYAEPIEFVGDVSDWVFPNDLQRVLPPVMGKRNSGRPKKNATHRIPSKGEVPTWKGCSRCGGEDHQKTKCRVPMHSSKSFIYDNDTVDLNEP